MRRLLVLLAPFALVGCLAPGGPNREVQANLLHVVAFQLSEAPPLERSQLAAELEEACTRDLSSIPGVVRLRAAQRDPRFQRATNLQTFDVLLVIEFVDKAAHDAYQTHPKHEALVQAWLPRLSAISVLDASR